MLYTSLSTKHSHFPYCVLCQLLLNSPRMVKTGSKRIPTDSNGFQRIVQTTTDFDCLTAGTVGVGLRLSTVLLP